VVNPSDSNPDPTRGRGGVLLLRTWNDGEAAMIKQLLETYGIPCQIVSDVPHTVLPLSVDGLGEVRILVPAERLEDAKNLLAEHRRQGLEMLDGDGSTGDDADGASE
jgi:hypothetical protein